MSTSPDLIAAIAQLLAFPDKPGADLEAVVREVLEMPAGPDRATLEALQRRIEGVPGASNSVGLVYGGATKIKGYVFEAPRLPEIRGASALLDWVNDQGIRAAWNEALASKLGNPDQIEQTIIYASGGSFLALAPAALAQDLAVAVEQRFTRETLTASSVAVTCNVQLLELRFGRDPRRYWVEEFLDDCRDQRRREALLGYYYAPEGLSPDDLGDEALRRRFLNRKSFGELVTVLASHFNRRRDERAAHGPVRSLPRYELLPWAAKCQSSDVRPAVLLASTSEDSSDDRLLSEPSARKLLAGRALKRQLREQDKLVEALNPWVLPADLAEKSWERQWTDYLAGEGKESPYARSHNWRSARAAQDVGEIGAASRPSRYIGLIYADGNNIGRLMATISSPGVYREVSHALSKVAKDSVLAALAEHLEPAPVPSRSGQRQELVHPFEILAIGGDDLFLVVPGDRAFAVALSIAQRFEAGLTERFEAIARHNPEFTLPPRHPAPQLSRYSGPSELARQLARSTPAVGLSAGVLVAQENAPFFFLRDLVEELLKRAKGLAKRHAADHDEAGQPKPRFYGGAVDFMVLKSTTMVTDRIGAFREAALNDHKGSKRRLTARPYAWGDFAGLIATAQALKKARVPRSQLYRLRRTLDQDDGEGVLTSTMEYLYTRSRQDQSAAGALLEHVETAWCLGNLGTVRRVAMPPWSPWGEDGFETVWPDLLELLDFAAGGEAR